MRATDTFARLGRDEFGILLAYGGDLEDTIQATERIFDAIERPFSIRQDPKSVQHLEAVELQDGSGILLLLTSRSKNY